MAVVLNRKREFVVCVGSVVLKKKTTFATLISRPHLRHSTVMCKASPLSYTSVPGNHSVGSILARCSILIHGIIEVVRLLVWLSHQLTLHQHVPPGLSSSTRSVKPKVRRNVLGCQRQHSRSLSAGKKQRIEQFGRTTCQNLTSRVVGPKCAGNLIGQPLQII